MQPNMQFMETTMLEHEVMDFQVEEMLGECTSNLKSNACHFNMWKLMDNVLHLNRRHHICGLMCDPMSSQILKNV